MHDFAPDYDLSFYFVQRRWPAVTVDSEEALLPAEGPARAGLADSERCESFYTIWVLAYDNSMSSTQHGDDEIKPALQGKRNSRAICEAAVYAARIRRNACCAEAHGAFGSRMKRVLNWIGIVLGCRVVAGGFCACETFAAQTLRRDLRDLIRSAARTRPPARPHKA